MVGNNARRCETALMRRLRITPMLAWVRVSAGLGKPPRTQQGAGDRIDGVAGQATARLRPGARGEEKGEHRLGPQLMCLLRALGKSRHRLKLGVMAGLLVAIVIANTIGQIK